MYNIEKDNLIQLEITLKPDGNIAARIRIKIDEQGNYLSCARVSKIVTAEYDELLITIYSLFINDKVSTEAAKILDALVAKRDKNYKPYEL